MKTTVKEFRANEIRIGKFVDLRSDFGFKIAFADKQNKEILIDFLNHLLAGKTKIVDLTYQNTVQLGNTSSSRQAIYSVRCTGSNNEQIIVEMQWARQKHFLERAMSHISMLVGDPAKRGEGWDFELPEVYFVGILDFDYQHSLPEKYLHKIEWRDDDPQHSVSLTGPEFLLLELPKFRLRAEDLHSDMEKWCFLLKNMGSLEEIPVSLNTGSFKKLFEIATVANYSKKKFDMYKQSLLAKQNQYTFRKSAREQGIEKGIEKGRKEEAKKAQKNTEKLIRHLLSDNRYSVSEISEMVGWSREAVQKMKESMAQNTSLN